MVLLLVVQFMLQFLLKANRPVQIHKTLHPKLLDLFRQLRILYAKNNESAQICFQEFLHQFIDLVKKKIQKNNINTLFLHMHDYSKRLSNFGLRE